MAKQKPRLLRGGWKTVLKARGGQKTDIVWKFLTKKEAEDWWGGKL